MLFKQRLNTVLMDKSITAKIPESDLFAKSL